MPWLVNFNVNVSLRPFKARDHHRLHRSLAHLLQQWPVTENRGKKQSEVVLETFAKQQGWRQIIFWYKSPTASLHRSWPARCFTSASIYSSNLSPSSSSRWLSGCCLKCSLWLPLTSGCWEGNHAILNTFIHKIEFTKKRLVRNSRKVWCLSRFSPSMTLLCKHTEQTLPSAWSV